MDDQIIMDSFRKFLEVLIEQRGGNRQEALRAGEIAIDALLSLCKDYTPEEIVLLGSPPITALMSCFPQSEDLESTLLALEVMMGVFGEAIQEEAEKTAT